MKKSTIGGIILGVIAVVMIGTIVALNASKKPLYTISGDGKYSFAEKDKEEEIVHEYGKNNGSDYVDYKEKIYYRELTKEDLMGTTKKPNATRWMSYFDYAEESGDHIIEDKGDGVLYIVDDKIYSSKDGKYYTIDINTKEVNDNPDISLIRLYINDKVLPPYTFNMDDPEKITIYSTYNDKSAWTIDSIKVDGKPVKNYIEYAGGNNVTEFFKVYTKDENTSAIKGILYCVNVESDEVTKMMDIASLTTNVFKSRLYYKSFDGDKILNQGYINMRTLEVVEGAESLHFDNFEYDENRNAYIYYATPDVSGDEIVNDKTLDYVFNKYKSGDIIEKARAGYYADHYNMDFDKWDDELSYNVELVEAFEDKVVVSLDLVARAYKDNQPTDVLIMREYDLYDLNKETLDTMYMVDLRPVE